jgi:hypothetical protein
VNYFTIRINDEGSVEEFLGELGMLDLCLRDDIGIVLLGLAP